MDNCEIHNFEIIKGQAYTEDYVLVYNIFVAYYSKKITDTHIKEYFEKFGTLKNINLIKKTSNFKYCTINFTESSAATKVLLHGAHYVNSIGIKLRAANSWLQPNADMASKYSIFFPNKCFNKKKAEVADDTTLAITNLNDDCLNCILSKLNIANQINFCRTCERFKDVFIKFQKRAYKILPLNALVHLTLWQTRYFLEMIGDNVYIIFGIVPEKNRKYIFELLGMYCTNVNAILMRNFKLDENILSKLLNKTTKLAALDLTHTSLNDNSIKTIVKTLPNLEELNVDGNINITGKFISQLKNLKKLSLHCCPKVDPNHFNDICKELTQLNWLNIKFCINLNVQNYEQMVKHLPNLESLMITFDSCDRYECIAKLPKLKKLVLHACNASSVIRPELFTELLKYQSDKLEYLLIISPDFMNIEKASMLLKFQNLKKLSCPYNSKLDDACLKQLSSLTKLEDINLKMCKNISQKGFLNLFMKCPKLKCINVSYNKSLKDDSILKLCQILQRQHYTNIRQEIVLVIAIKSGINENITENPEFIPYQHLIEISFDSKFLKYDDIDDCCSDDDDDDEVDNNDDNIEDRDDDDDMELQDSDNEFNDNDSEVEDDIEEDDNDAENDHNVEHLSVLLALSLLHHLVHNDD